jgi:hypothetical protein
MDRRQSSLGFVMSVQKLYLPVTLSLGMVQLFQLMQPQRRQSKNARRQSK